MSALRTFSTFRSLTWTSRAVRRIPWYVQRRAACRFLEKAGTLSNRPSQLHEPAGHVEQQPGTGGPLICTSRNSPNLDLSTACREIDTATQNFSSTFHHSYQVPSSQPYRPVEQTSTSCPDTTQTGSTLLQVDQGFYQMGFGPPPPSAGQPPCLPPPQPLLQCPGPSLMVYEPVDTAPKRQKSRASMVRPLAVPASAD